MSTNQERDDEDAAFEAGFDSVHQSPEAKAPADDAQPEAAAQPNEAAETPPQGTETTTEAKQEGDKPAEPPAVDPFAGLPKEVRDILARVPQMEQELAQTRRVANMVPALQSRLDKLASGSAATAQVPGRSRFESIERLRENGLPEIADALDELAELRTAGHDAAPVEQSPAPAADPVDPQMEVLDHVRPTWRDDVGDSDYQLWLSRQPAEYRDKVNTTTKARDILDSLDRFGAYRQQVTAATSTAQQIVSTRANRMAAAVTPQGDGRRAPSKALVEDDEEAGFNAGFAAVRGTR